MKNPLKIKTFGIGKSAFLISFLTILSSFLGIIKNNFLAAKFGTGTELDIYFAAFKIPEVLFLAIVTLASPFILIPLFEKKENVEKLKIYINKCLNSFLFFLTIISFLAFLLMPQIIDIFFKAFENQDRLALIEYSRILTLSIIFMGLASIIISINQKNHYFIPTIITGFLYNLSIILSIFILAPFLGIKGVIFGALFGSLLYLLIQLPTFFKEKLFIKKFYFLEKKEIKEIIKKGSPRSISLLIAELSFIYILAKSAFYGPGSVAMISLAFSIFVLPSSVVANSYSQAVFPKMTSLYFKNKIKEINQILSEIINRSLFFSIPISFFFFSFSFFIVGLILGSEKFGLNEIIKTASLLSLFSLSVIFYSLTTIIIRTFYALNNSIIPLFINSIIFLLTIFLITNFEKSENLLEILPLTYSISIFIGFLIIYFILKRKTGWKKIFDIKNLFKKILISLSASFISFKISNIFFTNIENSFFFFLKNFILISLSFILFFIIFSEISKEKNYLDFRKKIIKILINFFQNFKNKIN